VKLRAGTPEEAGMSPERVELVRQRARGWIGQGLTPGLVVMVARNGIVVLQDAIGLENREADAKPLRLDTIFPIASITKPMTATCAIILVDDGLLGLNRPVCEYVPDFTGEGKDQVMVHHLLTHTSGIHEDDSDIELILGGVEGIDDLTKKVSQSIKAYLERVHRAPLDRPPGQAMSYCLTAYNLLGEIVEQVSGKDIDTFARQRIFDPLGMADTFYSLPGSLANRVLHPPADGTVAPFDTPFWRMLPETSAAAFSTVPDLAVFGQMFLDGGTYGGERILSRAAVGEMTRNQIPGTSAVCEDEVFPEAGWGYGWCIEESKKPVTMPSLSSPETFDHTGVASLYLWIDPVNRIVGLYFPVLSRAENGRVPSWRGDLFANMVTAAVEDRR
jgi:serine-type D-Ala-D-Ala carboxypeptidase